MLNVLPKPTPVSKVLTGDHEADSLYLKNLLSLAGLSQSEVARRLGLSVTMVNKFIARRDNSTTVLSFFEGLHDQYGEKLRRLYLNVKQ